MTDRPDTNASARVARAEGLVASEVDGEVVLLSIDSGHFFQLNATGSGIWKLLDTPLTVAEICEKSRARFDVDEEACRLDVIEFVQGMIDKALLQRV